MDRLQEIQAKLEKQGEADLVAAVQEISAKFRGGGGPPFLRSHNAGDIDFEAAGRGMHFIATPVYNKAEMKKIADAARKKEKSGGRHWEGMEDREIVYEILEDRDNPHFTLSTEVGSAAFISKLRKLANWLDKYKTKHWFSVASE